ncbi:MAG TPA: hypothetical protein DCM59_14740, partial [Clostridium sp.]|nr:hypothetical protein [Clostridium sp.]
MIFISGDDKQILKRILKYISVYKKKIIFIVIIMIVSTGINFILPILNKKAIDDGLLKNDISMVIKVTILILAIILIILCVVYTRFYKNYKYIKYISITSIIVPTITSIVVSINFN